MMKLTVAFLGALAVADAANARGHRHARRQYGYGSGPETSAVYTAPANSTANTATLPPAVPSTTPVVVPTTTEVSPELPTPEVPVDSSSSTANVPGVSFPGTGTAPAGTAPASQGPPSDKPSTLPGMTYPVGTGTAPAPAPPAETPAPPAGTPSEVATPLPSTTTDVSPIGGANSTSTFPSFVLTGTGGTFPTGVPSGIYPTGTGSGSEDLVTLTISSTQIFTVTACPASVTNCPAKSTSLVTSVVAVGTTVCPESEASSIAASGLPSSAMATPTGAATTDVDSATKPVASEVVEDSTTVMTQTIGTGSNAHETKITITNQVTKTIYVTGKESLPVETSVSPEQTPAGPSGGKEEATTMVTNDITSTVAKTLTVTEGGPGATGSPSAGSPSDSTPSDVPAKPEGTPVAPSGGEGECAPPVTVTVTAQETVTVTAGGSSETGTPSQPETPEVPSEENTSISPEQPTPSAPGIPSGGAPYPTMNGTAPFVPGSTGFLTATKPIGSVPSGMPGYGAPMPSGSGAVPSGGASNTLPSFVLPSATPAEEAPAAPTTTPAGETTTSVSPEGPPPAETSAYGPGYGYGSKKRSFFGLF